MKKEKKKFWKKILIGTVITVTAGGCVFLGIKAWSLNKKLGESNSENNRLRRRNAELETLIDEQRGENKALYRENRKLSSENSNLNYQLGKKEAERRG
jgi:cell division protein FtsB